MTDFLQASLQAAQQGDAFAAYRLLVSAVAEDPENADAWYRLGCSLHDHQKYPAAVTAFTRSISLRPGDHQALTNLGLNLGLVGRYREALHTLDRAVAVSPEGALDWLHRSQILHTMGNSAATGSARKAVELAPDLPLSHMALSFCLMGDGNWLEGFREYEWRFRYKLPEFLTYPYPLWRGEETGTLLIQAEQGLGDTIQMMRYVRVAACGCERVKWLVHKELYSLAQGYVDARAELDIEVMAMPCPIPSADAFVPMMSLPVVLEIADVECDPYISVKAGLRVSDRDLHVGIVWAGSPDHENARHRDMPLEALLPLAEIPGVVLHSLQIGARRTDVDELGVHGILRDRSGEIMDMADTARVVAGLDLVICVDTAVGHLAGAMGKEVWLLVNQRSRDWRWLRSGETTDWYSSMRIFMRTLDEGWDDLVSRVGDKLKERVHA